MLFLIFGLWAPDLGIFNMNIVFEPLGSSWAPFPRPPLSSPCLPLSLSGPPLSGLPTWSPRCPLFVLCYPACPFSPCPFLVRSLSSCPLLVRSLSSSSSPLLLPALFVLFCVVLVLSLPAPCPLLVLFILFFAAACPLCSSLSCRCPLLARTLSSLWEWVGDGGL